MEVDDLPAPVYLPKEELEVDEAFVGVADRDGDDVLVGGAGSDELQGGAGNNIYRYEADAFEVEGVDSITGDFDGPTGGDDGDFDLIDLEPLLVGNGAPVVNGLEFVDVDADGNPPEAPNQVRVVSGENSSTVTVIGDTLDDQFSFTANAALDEADFLDIGASQAPDAEDDTGAVDEDATVAIPVLDNDSDPQGDDFGTISINDQAVVFGGTVTLASGAEATLNANGTITYDPTTAGFPDLALDEEFPDSFTYTIEDVAGNSDAGSTADVDVTVTGIEEGAEVTIDVNAAATFNATAEADIFTISVDDDGVDGGDIFGPGFDGTAIIDGFDPAQDILRFVNEAGSTVSEDDLLNEVGIEVAEDPFTPAVTYFFNLDPDGDEATVEIPGIGAQNADFIEVA